MQPISPVEDQVITAFLAASRQYLGLNIAPVRTLFANPGNRIYRYRQALKSLLVAGSLGAIVGNPAFATEVINPASNAERPPASTSASEAAPTEDASRPLPIRQRR